MGSLKLGKLVTLLFFCLILVSGSAHPDARENNKLDQLNRFATILCRSIELKDRELFDELKPTENEYIDWVTNGDKEKIKGREKIAFGKFSKQLNLEFNLLTDAKDGFGKLVTFQNIKISELPKMHGGSEISTLNLLVHIGDNFGTGFTYIATGVLHWNGSEWKIMDRFRALESPIPLPTSPAD